MSDITGPPLPKPLTPVNQGTDRTARVSRDPSQTPQQSTQDRGQSQSHNQANEASTVRQPAVSISASAAQLYVGEELREQVRSVDQEGRPIIVTETATFALRPDAGLKPGDDVLLRVIETEKQVAAELLRNNGITIDPPVKINLTVISVHVPEQLVTDPSKPVATAPVPGLDLPYKPAVATANNAATISTRLLPQETEALASLLSRPTLSAPIATSSVPLNPVFTAAPPANLARADGPDLATLIQVQQGTAPSGQQILSGQTTGQASPNSSAPHVIAQAQTSLTSGIIPTPLAPLSPNAHLNTSAVLPSEALTASINLDPSLSLAGKGLNAGSGIQAHLLPPSDLTAPVAANSLASVVSSVGTGPVIPAVLSTGGTAQLQVLDLSISRVPPAEIAQVTAVQPLTPEAARTLEIAPQALGVNALNAGALAQVITNKGSFIVAQSLAEGLVGEHIRFRVEQTATPVEQSTTPTYDARLAATSTAKSHKVQVQLTRVDGPVSEAVSRATNTAQGAIVSTIDAVHITRSFLTGNGPKSDLRLETSLGNITLTLANHKRPQIGDLLSVLPNTAALQSPLTTAETAVSPTLAASGTAAHITSTSVAQPTIPAPLEASIAATSVWPTLEQAFSLVQSASPTAANNLQARSAQGGEKLANSLLFLMTALKGGSASAWLGSALENEIAQKNTKLLKSLKDDLALLFRAGADPSNEWRPLVIPFDTRSGEVPLLTALFSQHAPVDPDGENTSGQEQDNEDAKDDQRFIVEVNFSVLGAIQLDGNIRGNRFDLTVWSEAALPTDLTRDTSELFKNALDASAFNGELHYRQGPKFPVNVAEVLRNQHTA